MTESSHNYCAEKINNKILLITTTMKLYDTTTEPTRLPSLGEQTLRQNLPLPRPSRKLTDGDEKDMKGETEGGGLFTAVMPGRGYGGTKTLNWRKSPATSYPPSVQAPLSWKERGSGVADWHSCPFYPFYPFSPFLSWVDTLQEHCLKKVMSGKVRRGREDKGRTY